MVSSSGSSVYDCGGSSLRSAMLLSVVSSSVAGVFSSSVADVGFSCVLGSTGEFSNIPFWGSSDGSGALLIVVSVSEALSFFSDCGVSFSTGIVSSITFKGFSSAGAAWSSWCGFAVG